MPTRAVIVDDEELARKRLRRLLKRYEDSIEIVGEASNGDEAVAVIAAAHPEVVFLDVQMPGPDGFEVLRRLTVKPIIVFVTAYDQYALRAFEENSVDYLLKPVEQARLDKTIEKIRRMNAGGTSSGGEAIGRLLSLLAREPLRRIKVQVGEKIYLIDIDEVSYFESREKYTYLHTVDKEYVIDETLGELERKLDPKTFIRVHRAHIVNVRFIRELVKWFAGRYKLRLADKNATELVVSRGYTQNIRQL